MYPPGRCISFFVPTHQYNETQYCKQTCHCGGRIGHCPIWPAAPLPLSGRVPGLRPLLEPNRPLCHSYRVFEQWFRPLPPRNADTKQAVSPLVEARRQQRHHRRGFPYTRICRGGSHAPIGQHLAHSVPPMHPAGGSGRHGVPLQASPRAYRPLD